MASFATKLSRAFPKLLLLAFLFGYLPYLVFKQSGCAEGERPVDEVFKEKPVLGAPTPGSAKPPPPTPAAKPPSPAATVDGKSDGGS